MVNKDDIVDILKKQYHDNKLSHAFLLETDDMEKCLKKILEFLKILNCEHSFSDKCLKCNLCHLIDEKELPSLVIIRPDGSFIRKEQILSLKESFKTKPIFSKYNMYIIMNAECLNSSSANTMLKFLEEPEEGIIGFFITNNKENVIETIKSRCQILLDYYFESFNNEDINNDVIEYIKEFESNKLNTLFYNKNVILPKIVDRNWLVSFFLKMIQIYEELYKVKLFNKEISNDYAILSFLLEKDDEYFLERLNLLKKIIKTLDYNVNNQLVLDRLVLESW